MVAAATALESRTHEKLCAQLVSPLHAVFKALVAAPDHTLSSEAVLDDCKLSMNELQDLVAASILSEQFDIVYTFAFRYEQRMIESKQVPAEALARYIRAVASPSRSLTPPTAGPAVV